MSALIPAFRTYAPVRPAHRYAHPARMPSPPALPRCLGRLLWPPALAVPPRGVLSGPGRLGSATVEQKPVSGPGKWATVAQLPVDEAVPVDRAVPVDGAVPGNDAVPVDPAWRVDRADEAGGSMDRAVPVDGRGAGGRAGGRWTGRRRWTGAGTVDPAWPVDRAVPGGARRWAGDHRDLVYVGVHWSPVISGEHGRVGSRLCWPSVRGRPVAFAGSGVRRVRDC
jgi:hypothetical protein